MVTATQLVDFVNNKVGCAYMWGAWGQTVSESFIAAKKAQYPSHYTNAYCTKCRKHLGKQAFDCHGLIKSLLMCGTSFNSSRYNGALDIGIKTAYNNAKTKGTIASIPDVPGVCVVMIDSAGTAQHIGVYVGGGVVVEARGVDYGVVKTALKSRAWTHWFQYANVDYSAPKAYSHNENCDLLAAKGLMNTPDYWKQNAVKGQSVKGEWVAELVARAAAALRS